MRSLVVILGILAGLPSLALAETTDKYHVTPQEKAACTEDAVRLCIQAYPDEDKLIVCMKTNRSQLSPGCLVVFDAGLKRRRR